MNKRKAPESVKKISKRRLIKYFTLKSAILFSLGAVLLSYPVSYPNAQTKEQIESAKKSGMTESEIRKHLKSAGLSDSEIRIQIDKMRKKRWLDQIKQSSGMKVQIDTSEFVEEGLLTDEMEEELPIARDTSTVIGKLRPFGYDIFNLSPTSFEPLNAGPVDPNYTLGPGDEIVLTLWGDTEQYYKLVLDREGKVLIPDVGQVFLTGISMRRSEEKIRNRLSSVYSGISPRSGSPSTFMDVSLGRLRSIRVFIVGEVVRPGGYTMRATSTSFNALYFAGGPNSQGSFRDIRVLRGGKLAASLDLYSYILYGNTKKDIRLHDGDTIFVPRRGRQVAISGEVHRPALYELKTNDGLKNLLTISGGLKPTAFIDRIQIDRIVPFEERDEYPEERKIIDIDYKSIMNGSRKDFKLIDSDVVSVFSILDFKRNLISVEGPVSRPGTYEWIQDMRLSDLIEESGGVLGDAFLNRVEIVRSHDDSTKELLKVNLLSALEGDTLHDIVLKKLDEVKIYSVREMEDAPTVTISGHILRPGKYNLLENMTLYDLVVKAGGMLDIGFKRLTYLDRADLKRLNDDVFRFQAEIARIDPWNLSENILAEIIKVDLPKILSNDGEYGEMFLLQEFDRVTIRRHPFRQLQGVVSISGEVKFPGEYVLQKPDEGIFDLVERSGGLTGDPFLRGARLTRNGQRVVVNFEKVLKKRSGKEDLVLLPGDQIMIPKSPKVVYVNGAVNAPGLIKYSSGKKARYYLNRAGGFHRDADRGEVLIARADGSVVKFQKRFWFDPTVHEGDEIKVSLKEEGEPFDLSEFLTQTTSIMASLATIIFVISQANLR